MFKNKKLMLFAFIALVFFIWFYPETALYLAFKSMLVLAILTIVLVILKAITYVSKKIILQINSMQEVKQSN